jgi:cytochrome P450
MLHLGSAIAFGAKPLQFLLSHAASLSSSSFVAIVAGSRMVFFTDPSSWPELLRSSPSLLRFDVIGVDVTTSAFGLTRFAAEQAILLQNKGGKGTHQQFIKYLQTREHLNQLSILANSHFRAELSAFVTNTTSKEASMGKRIPLFSALQPILFKATMHSLFGADHPLTKSPTAYDSFLAFDTKFPFLAGGAPLMAFPTAKKSLKHIADYLIPPTSINSACSGLMQARHELFTEIGLTDEMRGYSNAIIVWASVSNTMPSAVWCLHYLVNDDEAMLEVVKEVDAIWGADSELDVAKLDQAKILTSVIYETLRHQSSSMTVRRVEKTYDLKDGTRLRKGDRVCIFPPIVHFDDSVFENSEEFRYDRFVKRPDLISKVMPFGGGISQCPGRFFAIRELKGFVCHVLKYWKIKRVEGGAKEPVKDANRVGLGINQVVLGAEEVEVEVSERRKTD